MKLRFFVDAETGICLEIAAESDDERNDLAALAHQRGWTTREEFQANHLNGIVLGALAVVAQMPIVGFVNGESAKKAETADKTAEAAPGAENDAGSDQGNQV